MRLGWVWQGELPNNCQRVPRLVTEERTKSGPMRAAAEAAAHSVLLLNCDLPRQLPQPPAAPLDQQPCGQIVTVRSFETPKSANCRSEASNVCPPIVAVALASRKVPLPRSTSVRPPGSTL